MLLLGVLKIQLQHVSHIHAGLAFFPISDNYRKTMGLDVWVYFPFFYALVIAFRWAKPTADPVLARKPSHTSTVETNGSEPPAGGL